MPHQTSGLIFDIECLVLFNDFKIRRICENDCIGFDVINEGRETLVLEKDSQAVANLSVWATVRNDDAAGSGMF